MMLQDRKQPSFLSDTVGDDTWGSTVTCMTMSDSFGVLFNSLHVDVLVQYLQALTLGLWVQWPGGPVDLKTYWPPKKLTGPPKN